MYPKSPSNGPSALTGKRIVVFGGGAGIGRAIVIAARQAGAQVGCVDFNSEAADTVAREDGALPLVADVSDPQQVEAAVSHAVEAFGGLDGIVDLVGGWPGHYWREFAETGEDLWDLAIATNLSHAHRVARASIPALAASGAGSIVFITSISGVRSAPRHAPYGAAKAGLIHLGRSLAVELGPQGIRVNSIAPGAIETPRALSAPPESLRRIRESIPLQRMGIPAEIASAAVFLLSPAASYISGQDLVVDGGACANYPFPPPAHG
jgi:NAD(P)-dependent dehydrogenase (short-subunit alcohol dehydrogenase family)